MEEKSNFTLFKVQLHRFCQLQGKIIPDSSPDDEHPRRLILLIFTAMLFIVLLLGGTRLYILYKRRNDKKRNSREGFLRRLRNRQDTPEFDRAVDTSLMELSVLEQKLRQAENEQDQKEREFEEGPGSFIKKKSLDYAVKSRRVTSPHG